MADITLLESEAAALSVDEIALRLPIAVLLGEAVDLVGFGSRYWKAELSPDGSIRRPGLEHAGSALLPQDIIDQISALERLTYEGHRRYTLAVGPPGQTDVRAREVLSELSGALEWAFDDDVEDEWDQRLSSVRSQHEANTGSQDGLALALEDYAALSERALPRLETIPAFDKELIAEARLEARALRERSAPHDDPEAAKELESRNRYATLLFRRMQRLRRAARYVFRHQPDVARQSTSVYERRKRAESRRRAEAAKDTAADE